MNGWIIFETLATQIQTPLTDIANTMAAGLAGPVGNVIKAGAIAMIAWLMLKGTINPQGGNPLSDLEGKLILVGAVYLLASQTANYQQWVENLFMNQLGQEITALVSGGAGEVVTGKAFDTIWNTAYAGGLVVYKGLSWTDFALAMLVVLFWLCALLAIATGFVIWLASYVVLALLLGLGPLFIACYAFPPVRGIAERWLGSLIAMIILQVFVVALLAILTRTEMNMIGQIVAGGASADANNVAQLQQLLGGLALFFVCALVLVQLPGAASALSSGLTFHAGAIGGAMTAGAGAAVVGAHKGVAAGGRAVSAGIRSAASRAAPGRSLSSS